jgi:hypothetical protein
MLVWRTLLSSLNLSDAEHCCTHTGSVLIVTGKQHSSRTQTDRQQQFMHDLHYITTVQSKWTVTNWSAESWFSLVHPADPIECVKLSKLWSAVVKTKYLGNTHNNCQQCNHRKVTTSIKKQNSRSDCQKTQEKIPIWKRPWPLK